MDHIRRFRQTKAIAFDVDGVFTDNSLILTEQGDQLRTMSIRDGYAVKKALRAHYIILIITGGNSIGVRDRLQGLGVEHIYTGVENKTAVFNSFLEDTELTARDFLYMGDDIPDLEVMKTAGFASCPFDAVPEIKAISDYISPYSGGRGCVRDVLEKSMKLNGLWN